MYKRCEEILNKLANEGKIKKSNFYFPPKQELKLKLKDMLEDEVDEKYYLSDELAEKFNFNQSNGNVIGNLNMNKWQDSMKRIYNIDSYAPTINTYQGGNLEPKIVISNDKPKVIGGIGEKKSNDGKQWYQQDRIYDDNIALSVTTSFLPYYKTLRIRKLTPKECWRLMGFDDEDYEKVAKVNSNAQLYKQAGNSIVVNVLVEIFKNLFDKEGEIK